MRDGEGEAAAAIFPVFASLAIGFLVIKTASLYNERIVRSCDY